jgi:uncharacterized surface protein with fasciclin (FAS1) repeats
MSLARLVLLLRPVGLVSLSAVLSATIVITAAAPAAAAAQSADIVDTAVGAGQFTTLARALQAAGLVETLKGPGPFTVFAPTDAAFKRVPKRALHALLRNKTRLKAVLLYHVVAGRVTASDVVRLTSAKTLNGKSRIRVAGTNVFVNRAKVTMPDVMATNGVIHVVNRVLIPPVR